MEGAGDAVPHLPRIWGVCLQVRGFCWQKRGMRHAVGFIVA